MSIVSVNIAVLQDGKILLTQREYFETWVLPSGRVEEGESLAQAAIREAKEETGIDVELNRLVGQVRGFLRIGVITSSEASATLALADAICTPTPRRGGSRGR